MMYTCSKCGLKKPSDQFSRSQIKKAGTDKKCRSCTEVDDNTVSSASSNVKRNSRLSHNISVSPQSAPSAPMIPTAPQFFQSNLLPPSGQRQLNNLQTQTIPQPQQQQQFQHQLQVNIPVVPHEVYMQLMLENQTLKTENAMLKNKLENLRDEMDQLRIRVLDLGLPADIQKRLEENDAIIEQLEKENIALRKENLELKEQIASLQQQLNSHQTLINTQQQQLNHQEKLINEQQHQLNSQQKIMNQLQRSFTRENKLAIRCLVVDAKKKGQAIFTENEWSYITDKKLKSVVNYAAHAFPPERIKQAVELSKNRTVLETILKKVYPTENIDDDDSEEEFVTENEFTENDS